MEQWQAFLDTLGYRYWDENKNPAYRDLNENREVIKV
jgi:hypothetical protein